MESNGTTNMGCTYSTGRSNGDMQTRRFLEANELRNTSSQPRSVATPSSALNSSLQHQHLTLDTQVPTPNLDSNFLDQNGSLLSSQAPTPGIQHLPRPSFLQANQQYQDPWEARGCRFNHIFVYPIVWPTIFLTCRLSRNFL